MGSDGLTLTHTDTHAHSNHFHHLPIFLTQTPSLPPKSR